jgi:hypothetical protein
MLYLSTALVAEGPSDEWFLPIVLQQALREICAQRADVYVEIPDVQVLRPQAGDAGLVRGICNIADQALDDLAILFYHYDGTARPDKAAAKYWTPLTAAWADIRGGRELVAIVPVREMEAWALADPEALRTVFGTGSVRRRPFQSDRLADVERLDDPKRTLQEIAVGGRGGRQHGPDPAAYLTRIAELLSIERLRAVPSFQQWQADTIDALRKMRYLP